MESLPNITQAIGTFFVIGGFISLSALFFKSLFNEISEESALIFSIIGTVCLIIGLFCLHDPKSTIVTGFLLVCLSGASALVLLFKALFEAFDELATAIFFILFFVSLGFGFFLLKLVPKIAGW